MFRNSLNISFSTILKSDIRLSLHPSSGMGKMKERIVILETGQFYTSLFDTESLYEYYQ